MQNQGKPLNTHQNSTPFEKKGSGFEPSEREHHQKPSNEVGNGAMIKPFETHKCEGKPTMQNREKTTQTLQNCTPFEQKNSGFEPSEREHHQKPSNEVENEGKIKSFETHICEKLKLEYGDAKVMKMVDHKMEEREFEEGNNGGLVGPRERLKRHRREVAGRVWIPDIWGQENFLKDWMDCSAFDASLVPQGIMLARASLMEEGRRSNSRTLRVENGC